MRRGSIRGAFSWGVGNRGGGIRLSGQLRDLCRLRLGLSARDLSGKLSGGLITVSTGKADVVQYPTWETISSEDCFLVVANLTEAATGRF